MNSLMTALATFSLMIGGTVSLDHLIGRYVEASRPIKTLMIGGENDEEGDSPNLHTDVI